MGACPHWKLNNCLLFASGTCGKTAGIASVHAEMYRARSIETEDTTSLRIRTDNGVEIIFNGSTGAEPGADQREIDVECENGTILWTYDAKVRLFFKNRPEEEYNYPGDLTHQYLIYRNIKRRLDGERNAYLYTVEESLSFTKMINAAFNACPNITSIDKKHLYTVEKNGEKYTCISNIANIVRKCRENCRTFSEEGIDWITI